MGNSRVNHLLYANDLCCISTSLDGLQDLLNVCSHYAAEYEIIVINNGRSVEILFRSKRFALSCMPNCHIGDEVFKFSSFVKYLGVCIIDAIANNKDM